METPESLEVTIVGQPYSTLVISPNNQTLIAVSGSSCQVLSEHKKDFPRLLTHDSEVVGVFFEADDRLISVTENGEICEWEATDKTFEKLSSTRVTAFPVLCAFAQKPLNEENKKLELWLVVKKDGNKGFNKKTYDVCVTGANGSIETVLKIPGNLRKEQIHIADRVISYCSELEVHSIVLKDDEERSVALTTKHVAKPTEDGSISHHFERITANGDFLVASLSDGRVLEWSHLKTHGLQDVHHRIHWHKVGPHLAVTQFGSVLSAGAECVLARHSKGQGRPTLLSRLAAPVTGLALSLDSSTCALIMEDNSVHTVLLSTMAIKTTYSTLEHCPRSLNTVFMGDPLHLKKAVMNGKPGQLQWFDPFTVSTSARLHVTLENVIDGDMSARGIRCSFRDVLFASMTHEFIATIEKFVGFQGDNHLRFWQRGVPGRKDRLVASVTVPTDTVFLATCNSQESRYKNTIISATTSGTLSVWEYTEKDVREDVEKSRNWQQAPIQAVSRIQADGKFASAHGQHAVLWGVKNMKIIDVLSCDSAIKSLDFTADHRYLIICSASSVICWDTLCLLVTWRIQQSGIGIHVSPNGCFAFDGPQVMRFEPETGRVLSTVQFSANVDELLVVKYNNEANIFVAKTKKGILCHRPTRLGRARVPEIPAQTTPFHQLARISSPTTPSADQQFVQQPRPEAARLFAGPVHQLAPISFIAPLFIEKSLLPPPIRI